MDFDAPKKRKKHFCVEKKKNNNKYKQLTSTNNETRASNKRTALFVYPFGREIDERD